jgi:3-oxoacyl-[acyl-carrier protein] reductase
MGTKTTTIAGKAVLVTGANRGLGQALVEEALLRGATRVYAGSRGPFVHPDERVTPLRLDVTDPTQVQGAAEQVYSLDILINNAGVAAMNHALLTPMETVDRILGTNVGGTFLLCREGAKLMQRRRFGRIVNFGSVADPLRLEGEAIYAASKAAVVSLTRVLAREFAEYGITVNAIAPTPVATDLIRSVPSEKIDRLVARQAIRRLGEFRDIVNVVDFFVRPESDFVTGQVLTLGGVG